MRACAFILLVALTLAGTGLSSFAAAAIGGGAVVSGRVTDALTRSGLRAIVTATTAGGSQAGQTDDRGYYRFQIPAGTVTLTAASRGYAEQRRVLTLAAGQQVTVNFALRPRTPTPTPTRTPTPSPTLSPRPTPTPTPTRSPSPAPPPTTTPPPTGSRRWSDPQGWPSGRVPSRLDNVVIPEGDVVEVDTTAAEARTLTVHGTLRASRQVPSQLALYGNLIIRGRGILDYGRPVERVLVPAVIRWTLNEANYMGGDTMTPLSSDVGLWAIDDAQVWIHGAYRDTWSPLARPARAGEVEITVDPSYAVGWRVGDEVVVGPSHLKQAFADDQDEIRQIVAIQGEGVFRLSAPLRYDHDARAVTWTDAWGDTWTEWLAAKVINLTANITFQAADPNHRPHVMFLARAKHYVEDLAVQNFSPMPRRNPMARYAWHEHEQGEGSRGSYLRRARLFGGPGEGWHIHGSYGIEGTDVVIYNQARAYVVLRDGSWFTNTRPFMLERSRERRERGQFHAADDCRVDRLLVMRWGVEARDYRNAGVWLSGSVNCAMVGAVAAGGAGQVRSSGVHWEEGGADGGETPYLYRAEAHSNQIMGFHSWQNETPAQRIVDLLAWRNGQTGLGWGAYSTRYWAHQVRAIGNGQAQLAHWASGWGITGFLADGQGSGAGIEVRGYVQPSTSDSIYEDGVVRNVRVNARHEPDTASAGAVSWVQFARVAWDPAAPVQFGPAAVPPPRSRLRFRAQTGLPRAANFTLYRVSDLVASSVADREYGARRVDNDSAGTHPRPPRVRLVTPDEMVTSGVVRLEVETDAAAVDFYEANHRLARVSASGGRATLDVNMAAFPYRRAYFWAQVTGTNGAANTTRVIRVRRS